MTNDICWISIADLSEAGTEVNAAYDTLRREDGTIHNLYRAFSQFPGPVGAADRLYRDIMHAPQAPLPMWLTELLSVDVAILNKCDYAEAHHADNFLRLYDDAETAERMLAALKQDQLGSDVFDAKVGRLLEFGRKLTRQPGEMTAHDIAALHNAGLNDAEISQAVQVTASFAYWTRFINALGVKIGGERIGKYR